MIPTGSGAGASGCLYSVAGIDSDGLNCGAVMLPSESTVTSGSAKGAPGKITAI